MIFFEFNKPNFLLYPALSTQESIDKADYSEFNALVAVQFLR
jgi:hypothetical protein